MKSAVVTGSARAGSAARKSGLRARWVATPGWERCLLGVAVIAAVGGGVWTLMGGESPAHSSVAGAPGALGTTLVSEGTVAGTGGDDPGVESFVAEPTSKGVFRLGFSFVACFCIGLFVRTVLKLAAVAVGFWLVMTFALAQADLVTVDWQAINDLFEAFVARAEREVESFKGFVLGSLPAAGLGATGLVLGFRRR